MEFRAPALAIVAILIMALSARGGEQSAPQLPPIEVSLEAQAETISAGNGNARALRADGAATCWGSSAIN